jgi:hypothetical protein
VLLPRRFNLDAGVMLDQITANGPVIELADQSKHSIGLNRSTALDNLIQKDEDISACDIECLPVPPVGQHFSVQ